MFDVTGKGVQNRGIFSGAACGVVSTLFFNKQVHVGVLLGKEYSCTIKVLGFSTDLFTLFFTTLKDMIQLVLHNSTPPINSEANLKGYNK
jgi:hypothetical protein